MVQYLWVINNATSIRSVPTLERGNFDGAGTYSVELIVFDDDGASDAKQVNVVIVDATESLGQESFSSPVTIGLFILIMLACTAWLARQRVESENDLPKWNAPETVHQRENGQRHPGLDATIEEDEARG